MKIKSRVLKIFTATIVAALLIVGCAKGNDSKNTSTSNSKEVKKVLVATSGSPKPYVWVNEKNELDGYDIAVVKEIAGLLPQYDIQFEKTQFPSIFAGIDSGRYQVGANNITKKPEREQKYLFGNEYYYMNQTLIITKKGRTDIKSLEDLGGKKISVNPGGFSQLFIEQFNKDHPNNKIVVNYTNQDDSKTYQDINSGASDFTFAEKVMLQNIKDTYKIDLDYVELPKEQMIKIQDPAAYFVFSKTGDGPKIRDDFDNAIKTLIKNGKLKELSIKYFGSDYTGR
ncbi:transporter substrate-binding domain-containing protein [Clostridium sp. OS1-26]|uniref:transporter substrate-binding domain-containing protein n=1 Tax=Clostridium sp. OS1-26 TaxID=3070681 RepID=UPI0027DEE1EB|nr:transporter substrate-binding domain-containing protein [Clostridium sp. OS1-26]WML32840.1 transporter substrate-binding domain-containing protein [Clostridium sp. OS1-26]